MGLRNSRYLQVKDKKEGLYQRKAWESPVGGSDNYTISYQNKKTLLAGGKIWRVD